MTCRSHWRGHSIYTKGWFYSDTNQKVSDNPSRRCKRCKKENRMDDHDPCLGKLPHVMNACCGHGVKSFAYVQFIDKSSIHGKEAIEIIEILKEEVDK